MKFSRLILLLTIFAVFPLLFSCKTASKTDQKYAIVTSVDASDTEVYAAQLLSEYLSAINKKDYPIIKDDQVFEGFKFCIGETSVYNTSEIKGKAADSYIIAPFSNGLAIYGSGSRGTVYGVCAFLEDFCGYKYYTWDSGMVSTSRKIIFPKKKIEYNTYFEYRETDWRTGWTPLYSLANKLNGESYRGLTQEQGGSIRYLGGSSHTLSTVFCSSDKYFESHPEYFALHEGKRVPGQLCLTNDKVYNIVLEEVFELLKKDYDLKADLQIISLSQADNQDYCECDSCKALDSANGSHAGSMITFVNRIAHAIKEKGYGNVEFDTLAYMYTRKAPSAVVPEDNVIIRLCTLECCFSHPMDDSDCPENKKLMKDLEEWSEISNKMYIWDYTTNYACTLGIFPDFHVLQKNLQCFYEHGIKGIYEEGNYYIHKCDTEFGELRSFLIAKLLEDPYCDYDAEMLDFCKFYYGEGGEYIKKAVDEITENTKKHVSIYSSMAKTFSITENEAEEIDDLWSKAEKATGKSDALEAIKRSKLSWRYVKAALGLREFKGTLEDNKKEREALYNDLISHEVEMINEWVGIEKDFAEYEQIPVEEWEYAGRYYYLQYDLMGGTNGPPNQWCDVGASWIPETVPTREGYRFQGWASKRDEVDAEYTVGSFIYITSDMTLYAVWEKSPKSENSETQQGNAEPFSSYTLYIAGNKVDSQNTESLQDLKSIVLRDGGYIRYDDSLRTLYLKDVEIIPPKGQKNDGTAISYNSQDNTPLTVIVEGSCSLKSREYVQDSDSLMVMAAWGNLHINLQQAAVLEIEASPCRDKYTNIGIFMDSGRTFMVSGPGMLKVSGGDARPDDGGSIALYAQGDVIFEKDCSVNIISDTDSATNVGCWIEDGDLTFKDGSQIRIEGGKSGLSYGIYFINDRIYNLNAENWTGSLTATGFSGAIRCGGGKNACINRDSKKIRLTGYTETGDRKGTLLDKETYKDNALQKYIKLFFEGCDK